MASRWRALAVSFILIALMACTGLTIALGSLPGPLDWQRFDDVYYPPPPTNQLHANITPRTRRPPPR